MFGPEFRLLFNNINFNLCMLAAAVTAYFPSNQLLLFVFARRTDAAIHAAISCVGLCYC